MACEGRHQKEKREAGTPRDTSSPDPTSIAAATPPAIANLPRSVVRRRTPHGRRRAHRLHGAIALLGCHLTPLLAQLCASFRRHLPKTREGFPHLLLPLGRQCLVLLVALTHHLPLLGRHGAPLGKPLLRSGALLRRHRYPPLATFGERLLALGRQAIPLILVIVQQLLLLMRKRIPSFWRGRSGGHACALPGHEFLGETGNGTAKTRADQQYPYHFLASCGSLAEAFFPNGGAFFKNSHHAASPTSSEPKNSRKLSSGAPAAGEPAGGVAAAGCVPPAGLPEATGGCADAPGGVSSPSVPAPALAHAATSSHAFHVPPSCKLGWRHRIDRPIREIIKVDVVL